MATVVRTGTTPGGTPWTLYQESVSGAGTVYWSVPSSEIGQTGVPVCLYTHGAGGGPSQFHDLDAFSGIRNYMLDSGVVTVEGTGGGSQPWANDSSKTAYENTWQHVADLFEPEVTFGLFRSMGGLVGQWLLTQSSVVAENMQGAMVNSGVQDLMWAYQSGSWTAAMNSAWGVSSYSQFQAAAASSDPMQFASSDWTGKKMLQLVGTADTLVPAEQNGIAIRGHYSGSPEVDLLDIRPGGDHSTGNGSYLQVSAMANFVDLMLGKGPDPVPEVSGFRTIVSAGRLTNGNWHVMRPRW